MLIGDPPARPLADRVREASVMAGDVPWRESRPRRRAATTWSAARAWPGSPR
ncbi:MAG: hypothetical protein IPI34_04105 [bacterium]|nr:hypothetical protein [bacterium]